MSTNIKYSYSPNGTELALTTGDGKLLVFDSKTGKQRNEFVPSAHLSSSACTCLSWKPTSSLSNDSKRKSRKRKISTSSQNSTTLVNGGGGDADVVNAISDTIALGTSSGGILIYSLKTGESSTIPGDSGAINAVTWSENGNEVFAGSDDGFVTTFNVRKSLVISKFRASVTRRKEAVHSLALRPSRQQQQRHLLVGTVAKITLWDLAAKTSLKLFEGGHIGPVTSIVLIPNNIKSNNNDDGDKTKNLKPEERFLSLASSEQDHNVSLWNLDQAEASHHVSFAANEPVTSVFTAGANLPTLAIGVITKSGILNYYEHTIAAADKKVKNKPIKALSTLQIAAEKNLSSKRVHKIPVLAAKFASHDIDDDENRIEFAHGSHLKPTFESLDIDTMEKSTCLIRPAPVLLSNNNSSNSNDVSSASGVVIPSTKSAVVLAPGPSMMTESRSGTKRKTSESGKSDTMTMADRLKLLSHDQEAKSTTPPRTDSVLQLLLQGLHNGDRKILDSVLERADEELIHNTVKRLPFQAVVPLIEELQHYIQNRSLVVQAHAKWLKAVLQHHSSQMMASPQCVEIMAPIFSMLQSKTRHYNKLLQLRGKLDIVTKQISFANTNVDEELEAGSKDAEKEALLVYQDDSSDELSERLDDMLIPDSDTDDDVLDEESDEVSEGDEEEEDSDENDPDPEPMTNGIGSESEEDVDDQ